MKIACISLGCPKNQVDLDGMVHISKLENHRVEKVEDVLNLGDMTWVKFMGFDEKGRANFSRKDALKEMANQ